MNSQHDSTNRNDVSDSPILDVAASGGGAFYGLKGGALVGLAVLGPLGIVPGALIGLSAGSYGGRTLLRWLRGS